LEGKSSTPPPSVIVGGKWLAASHQLSISCCVIRQRHHACGALVGDVVIVAGKAGDNKKLAIVQVFADKDQERASYGKVQGLHCPERHTTSYFSPARLAVRTMALYLSQFLGGVYPELGKNIWLLLLSLIVAQHKHPQAF
jgi:hypothetical protein